MRIDTKTRFCALIGDPVEHSLSPAIHNAAFEFLGLNFAYLCFRVRDCAGALTGMRAFDQLIGLSVTIPHKMSVVKYLDTVEDVAARIGSVNTIVKEGDILKGYNTDGYGALKALKRAGVETGGENVLMLGSGGVARSIAFSLLMDKSPPETLCILGIDEAQLNGLVCDLMLLKTSAVKGKRIEEGSLKEEIRRAHILIHCTPSGMWPDINKSIVPADLLHPDLAVFDVVYNPLKTRLLMDAEQRGCRIVKGLDMFLYQAAGQFELWTGHDAPFDTMKEKAIERL